MELFDVAFEHILKVEGESYTNHPNDLGGPTKYGITLKTYNDFFGNNADAITIQSMTRETARSIYKTFFWYKLNLDRIAVTHPRLALVMFDQAVNRGRGGMVRLIQKSVNQIRGSRILDDDGILGEKTFSEIVATPELVLGLQFFKNMQVSYVNIVKDNPSQIVFLGGWINRTHSVLNILAQGRPWS